MTNPTGAVKLTDAEKSRLKELYPETWAFLVGLSVEGGGTMHVYRAHCAKLASELAELSRAAIADGAAS